MRFLLYDRMTKVLPGERVEAVKCVSLTEEYFKEHYPRVPLVPPALVLEAMVRVLGGLVMVTHEFRLLPFLSVLEDAVLPNDLRPGCRIDLVGELISTNPVGSMGRTQALVDGRVVASAGRVLFGHFPAPDAAAIRARFEACGALP